MDALLNKYNLMSEDEDSYDFKKTHYTQRTMEHTNRGTLHKSTNIVLYQASSLKWYEDRQHVQDINLFIEMGEAQTDGRCIVCVGEDDEVHSAIGNYRDVFNIYMKVELQ